MTVFLFWLVAGIVLYVYAGYPLLMALLARLARNGVRAAPIEPSVSLLVAAKTRLRSSRPSCRIRSLWTTLPTGSRS